MTYAELEKALAVFNIPRRATMRQIKQRHRELVKLAHPDLPGGGDSERIRQINEAYRCLLDYCENYRFSFAEDEFLEQNPEERLRRQFAADPLWGSK
jgi:curved DNA-binding protein CbpA